MSESRSAILTGGLGVMMVICCLAAPAVIGAIGGAAIGGALGIAVACVLALAVGGTLHWRARKRGRACSAGLCEHRARGSQVDRPVRRRRDRRDRRRLADLAGRPRAPRGAWIGAGIVALAAYGFVATLQDDNNFGRILAAYGGIFVAGSLAWGIVADGFRPDRYDLAAPPSASSASPSSCSPAADRAPTALAYWALSDV